ncbi:hypothetical protein CTI12_AA418440 [Artemisia annua]|uniref:RRM domain-containing protein n=1 Tax=Artemisia annua TaxID=35608 RepID=A0A2U1M5Q7_ARTAN|nr:hypothetical protein CTI12_AA418440 [Artemisia annua]
MGKQSFITDAKGWTWTFRNSKNPNLRNINNPYIKDLDRIATSFYVSNFPESLDAKGLWNACTSYGRLVDAFIANKRSKGGKRFGFIRFLGIKDAHEFVRSLSNIWIGSFHLYVAVALSQRGENPKTESIPKTEAFPKLSDYQSQTTKPSFADIIHNKQKHTMPIHTPETFRTINLNDNDLITIEESSTILLLKLTEVDTLSNMYAICKNDGFKDLTIHHVGGLWIWIQFSSSSSCSKFRENANIKGLSSAIRTPSPSFKVDERMIWLEISGLPLCAWGSNAYKKVASLFGKFKFFEDEESTGMSLGRVCISTRSYKHISENIKVEVNEEMFDVNVHEIGTWNINITDNSSDTSSHMDANHLDKDDISMEDKPDDDLDDLNVILNDLDQPNTKEEIPFEASNDIELDQPLKHVEAEVFKRADEEFTKVSDSSDLSRPPGFEHMKRSFSNTSKCSTNFARHHKNDIKGISLIHELNKLLKLGPH